jgi:hypothetical protein
MMSRSHQGMLSPPVKKLPTDSKNLFNFASIAGVADLRSRLGGVEGRGGNRAVAFGRKLGDLAADAVADSVS